MEPGVPTEQPTSEQPKEQPTTRASAADRFFEEWWRAYPSQRRAAKDKCRAKYGAILRAGKQGDKPGVTPGQLLAAVQAYAQSRDVARGFACQPYRWLNEQRWTLDYSAPDPQRRGRDAPGMFEAAHEITDLLERTITDE
jgi:hypothetical protein